MVLRSALALALISVIAVMGAFAQKPDGKPETVKSNKDTSGTTIFEGKLIDAECHGAEKCRVSAATKDFGLILMDGTYLKFDEGGNAKVKTFLQASNRGRKMLKAKPDSAKRITVKAGGTRTGDTFNLETIK